MQSSVYIAASSRMEIANTTADLMSGHIVMATSR